MPIKAKKVLDNSSGNFTETVKFEVLHQGNVEVNHNKFYCLELQKNPSTDKYRLFSHYGRLGKTNVYDVRDECDGESLTLEQAEKEYNTILRKKKKGKKVGDGREQYVTIDTVTPTVGSENICNKQMKTVQKKVSKIDTSSYTDPEVVRIIDQITAENIHNITSTTSLKLTVDGFETPLGPVTKEHVEKAREPLNAMKILLNEAGELDEELKEIREANNYYYSLIPHSFGHKITKDDWILNDVKLLEEFDLLDQLETAVQMGSSLNKSAQNKLNALGTDVELIKDKTQINRIFRKARDSRARNHVGMDIYDWKVKTVFKIKIPNERKRFESKGKKLGNVKELFHGSKNCNILSILKNGLIIPPCNAGHVTGRMFGDGVYFASSSTKSLNYSTDFWNSSYRSKSNNLFLFLVDVAMGKFYEAFSMMSRGAPKGYNSIWAKAGRSLYNDEFIVYNLSQQTVTYLIEMRRQ